MKRFASPQKSPSQNDGEAGTIMKFRGIGDWEHIKDVVPPVLYFWTKRSFPTVSKSTPISDVDLLRERIHHLFQVLFEHIGMNVAKCHMAPLVDLLNLEHDIGAEVLCARAKRRKASIP